MIELIKHTLKWIGHVEIMDGDERKRTYKGRVDAVGMRGRTLIK